MVSSGMGSFTGANDPLEGIRVNAVDPGYTATDHAGVQDGPTGGFFNREGAVPW